MSIRLLCNVLEMYFMYCNTLLLDSSTIVIIIIASIDFDNTLEMYFDATLELIVNPLNFSCTAIYVANISYSISIIIGSKFCVHMKSNKLALITYNKPVDIHINLSHLL